MCFVSSLYLIGQDAVARRGPQLEQDHVVFSFQNSNTGMTRGSFSVTTAELAALSHFGIVPACVSELIKHSLRLLGKTLQALVCGCHLCFLSLSFPDPWC